MNTHDACLECNNILRRDFIKNGKCINCLNNEKFEPYLKIEKCYKCNLSYCDSALTQIKAGFICDKCLTKIKKEINYLENLLDNYLRVYNDEIDEDFKESLLKLFSSYLTGLIKLRNEL